jgi:glycosyltransferase involved in cell wall biosynthesis
MKILHLLGPVKLPKEPFQAPMSGISTAVLEISRIQAKRGHFVTVATAGTSFWKNSWEGVELINLKLLPWAHFQFFGKHLDIRYHPPFLLHTYLRNYDIIHSHSYSYLRWLKSRKKIVHFHGDPFFIGNNEEESLDLKPQDFARILADTTAQIAVSNFVADQYNIGFKQKGNISVIHNGVNQDRFNYLDETIKKNYRRKFNIPLAAKVILFAGAITQEKGVRYLAKAFKSITKNFNNVYLLIVGGSNLWGNQKQEDSRVRYELSIKELLSSEIKKGKAIFTGKQPQAEMPNFYHISDIVVVPSIWQEAFPLVSLEAIAAGKPVITSLTGGMGDVLSDQNSIHVKPGDVKTLETAIIKLLTDSSLYDALARQAKLDSKIFTWEATVDKIMAVYNQL